MWDLVGNPEDRLSKNEAQLKEMMYSIDEFDKMVTYEVRFEKTGLRGFRPGPTQTGLRNHWI